MMNHYSYYYSPYGQPGFEQQYYDQTDYGPSAPKQPKLNELNEYEQQYYEYDQTCYGPEYEQQYYEDDQTCYGPSAPKQPKFDKHPARMKPFSTGGHMNQAFMAGQQSGRSSVPSAYVPGGVNRFPLPGPTYSPSLYSGGNAAPDRQEQGVQNTHYQFQDVDGSVVSKPYRPSPGQLQNDRKGLSQPYQKPDGDSSTADAVANKTDSNTGDTNMIALNSTDIGETEERKQRKGQYTMEAYGSESEIADTSLKHTGIECEKSNVSILPEIPAEREINRITKSLDDLEKRTYHFLFNKDVSQLSKEENRQYMELKKQKNQLQKRRKTEMNRLHMQNVQLSIQMQQNYNLGAYPCDLTPAEKKLTREEEACEQKLDELVKATLMMSNLEIKIDRLETISETEDRDLTGYEKGVLKESLTRSGLLQNRTKQLQDDRMKLLKQAREKRYGTDPFSMLVKLGKKIKVWRNLRQSGINIAQAELHERSVHQSAEEVSEYEAEEIQEVDMNETGQPATPSKKQSEAEEIEVIVISDEEDDELNLTVPDGKHFKTKKALKKWKRQQAFERHRCEQINMAKDIDGCVRKTSLVADIDQSYFLLSGLASILLARKQHRKQDQDQLHHHTQQQEAMNTCPTADPSAHCQLIGQIANKLNLTAPQKLAEKDLQRERSKAGMLKAGMLIVT